MKQLLPFLITVGWRWDKTQLLHTYIYIYIMWVYKSTVKVKDLLLSYFHKRKYYFICPKVCTSTTMLRSCFPFSSKSRLQTKSNLPRNALYNTETYSGGHEKNLRKDFTPIISALYVTDTQSAKRFLYME